MLQISIPFISGQVVISEISGLDNLTKLVSIPFISGQVVIKVGEKFVPNDGFNPLYIGSSRNVIDWALEVTSEGFNPLYIGSSRNNSLMGEWLVSCSVSIPFISGQVVIPN